MSLNTQFEFELKRAIGEEVKRLSDIMTNTRSIRSMEEYQYNLGQIAGYRRVVEYFDDVNKRISEGKR